MAAIAVKIARLRWLPCLLAAACTARAAHPIPIAVLELGDREAIGSLHADGLAPYEVTPPASPPAPADSTNDAIARVRAAYVAGELDACANAVAAISVEDQLARGDRASASRVLELGAACAVGARDLAGARTFADAIASYGLEPREQIAPDAERLIGQAIEAAGRAARSSLAIHGVAGAHVAVDGRPDRCVAPCELELAPGKHVIAATADGFAPAHVVVRVPDQTVVELDQAPASALLAAQQWRARTTSGASPADAVGAALVAKFVPDRRVVIVRGGPHVDGELVVDGLRVAIKEAPRGDSPELLRELAYDGGVLHRPAVWQRPWFWIAVTGAVVAIAAGIVAVTYQPRVVTSVGL